MPNTLLLNHNVKWPLIKKFNEILFGQGKYFKSEGFSPIINCSIETYIQIIDRHLYLTVKSNMLELGRK